MTEALKNPMVVTLSGEMPLKRQMVLQTGVDQNADQQTINEMLDKMRIAFERQFAFGEKEVHKLELEQQEKMAKDHAMRIAQVEENVYRDWQTNGRRGEQKLSHAQQKEKEQAYANAESIKERIARLKSNIAACDEKIAG